MQSVKWEDFIAVVVFAIVVIQAFIAYFNYRRQRDDQTTKQTSKSISVEILVGSIQSSLNELRVDLRTGFEKFGEKISCIEKEVIEIKTNYRNLKDDVDRIHKKISKTQGPEGDSDG